MFAAGGLLLAMAAPMGDQCDCGRAETGASRCLGVFPLGARSIGPSPWARRGTSETTKHWPKQHCAVLPRCHVNAARGVRGGVSGGPMSYWVLRRVACGVWLAGCRWKCFAGWSGSISREESVGGWLAECNCRFFAVRCEMTSGPPADCQIQAISTWTAQAPGGAGQWQPPESCAGLLFCGVPRKFSVRCMLLQCLATLN